MSCRSRLVMALVLTGCGSRAVPPPALPSPPSEFRRLELPGFSIDVPTGLGVGVGNITDYNAGDVRMQGSGRWFEVSWHVGVIFLGDRLAEIVRGSVAASQGRFAEMVRGYAATSQDHRYELREPQTTIAGPHLAGVVEFTIDDQEFAWANIECGRRAVMLIIGGPQVMALRHHILDSFDCHPVAVTELALYDDAPIGVDEPDLLADWHRIDDRLFMLSNDVFELMFHVVAGRDFRDAESRNALMDVINKFSGLTWSNTRLEKRWARDGGERIFQHGTIEISGKRRPGLLTAWQCGDQSLFGIVVPLIAVSDLSSVMDLIMKLHCARPGDPPLHLRQGHT